MEYLILYQPYKHKHKIFRTVKVYVDLGGIDINVMAVRLDGR